MSSAPMDLDIEVRRRDSKYILIAHRYGVVVRASDLQAGMAELERRVAMIVSDLEDAGIPSRAGVLPSGNTEPRQRDRVGPSMAVIVTVGAVLASFILLATAPIVNALAGVRAGISELARPENRPSVAALGRSGTDLIITLGRALDQVTPERKEELRTAIRRIAREVESIVEDVRSAPPPSPGRPNDATK